MGVKFVVLDRDGLLMSDRRDEESARDVVLRLDREYPEDAPHTIHPIGPALPAKVADITREADAAFAAMYPASDPISASPVAWKTARDVASAVIAAHEAGKVAAVKFVTWRLRGTDGYDSEPFFSLSDARDARGPNERIVRITTRRRRVAK